MIHYLVSCPVLLFNPGRGGGVVSCNPSQDLFDFSLQGCFIGGGIDSVVYLRLFVSCLMWPCETFSGIKSNTNKT